MPGNSQRKGAVRRRGKGNTAGSGGRVRRGLEGKGPTPKAEDRPVPRRLPGQEGRPGTDAAVERPPQRTGRPGAGPEWVAGRNAVLEAMTAGIPTKAAYVAEGAERDDRLRDILKLAADRGLGAAGGHPGRAGPADRRGGAPGRRAAAPGLQVRPPRRPAGHALEADTPALVVALDGVTDPRNLGAIVRSAAAFGAHGVLIPERRAAGMTAAAWKTSAGAAARIPIARATNLNRSLRAYADAGFTLVGLDGRADTAIGEIAQGSGPLVLVVGSEDTGLSRLVREACDAVAAIPISGEVESLNAGVAAGIALYEITRQRR